MKYFLIYLIIINLVSFILYGLDKSFSKLKKWRISERGLFLLSLFGGGVGSLIGMILFRHKTKKIKFYIWNIIMIGIWFYLCYKYLEVGGYLWK